MVASWPSIRTKTLCFKCFKCAKLLYRGPHPVAAKVQTINVKYVGMVMILDISLAQNRPPEWLWQVGWKT